MHVIRSATLRPGATLASIGETPAKEVNRGQKRLIRGKALIFWDPTLPGTKYGKKRDAIDTDQITPAADCVSETLEKLDERWKAGAFRYLMPDFRARVHRGETIVIAGDRFAIGSSREMSPAGLKAIADEARSEEHTSELQSRRDLVCRRLLEKKKNTWAMLASLLSELSRLIRALPGTGSRCR